MFYIQMFIWFMISTYAINKKPYKEGTRIVDHRFQ